MCEILAPAGDRDSFLAAVHSGANAVYLGLTDFSARKSAANFSLENLKDTVDYAHMLGVKVYVALNTLVKEEETERFFDSARAAWNAGADALIIQDVFLGKALKRSYPEMVLHLSTQAGVCNLYGAKLAKRYGFSRVILARETPLQGIRRIAEIIETEVFVQGALCTCFSGQCYLSAFIGGNSGNRGLCKQPCRKKYKIDRKGFETLSYKLSLSDLCLGKDVAALCEAGVASFKIEGRMRSAAYVGASVKYYADLLRNQAKALSSDLSDLKRTFNRGDYTRGYLFGQDKNLISSSVQGHKGELIGRIAKGTDRSGKLAFVRSDFVPCQGDGFKVIRNDTEIGGGSYQASFPKKAGGFYLLKNEDYKEGDGVYLTLDNALSARISDRKRTVGITLKIEAEEGKAPVAVVGGAFGERSIVADFVCESAKTRALDSKEIEDCFRKTDAYPFAAEVRDIQIKGKPFALKSLLNAFRRKVYGETASLLAGGRKPLPKREVRKNENRLAQPFFHFAVIDSDYSYMKGFAEPMDAVIFSPKNYKNLEEISDFLQFSKYYAWHKYLYLPAYMTDEDIDSILSYADKFDGAYAEGVWAVEFCKERKIPLFAGCGFNLFNSYSLNELAEENVCAAAVSKELSLKERSQLKNVFALSDGAVKVMELGHCPFSKSCSSCDKREYYILSDEQGRDFTLRRYENSVCRFELFNCLPLSARKGEWMISDLRTLSAEEKSAVLSGEKLSSSTVGLSSSGVL